MKKPIVLPSLLLAATAALSQTTTPMLSVDATANRHAISPHVYGIVGYGLDAQFAQEIHVPNVRWGGDGATRYNWQVDSSNSGFDWYFMGGNGQTNPVPSAGPDGMINTFKAAGAGTLITIPIIPWVNSTSAWTCSFPVSVYGPQQSTNPYVHPNGDNCGNSLSASGAQLTDTTVTANNVANSVALQTGWLQHLVSTFGTAAEGGVPFYQLDNEPFGWGNTHRDVVPGGASYPTIFSLGSQYAAAIKGVDPSAKVLGPSDFTLGGWIGDTSSAGGQNGLLAGQYYLQQMAAYEKANGRRILDSFDEHYYGIASGGGTDAATELASTRALWDPTYNSGSWVEQWFFNGPMQLIPRFQGWINQYYPGTALSFSEYSFVGANTGLADALTEADALGIFGQQGVMLANMWTPPQPTDAVANSFRLYRDFDGKGGQYGETWVQSASSSPTQLALYGAQRSADGALTLVILNKTANAIYTSLALQDFQPSGPGLVYCYSGANLSSIVQQNNVTVSATGFSYSFPAMSATVVVIPGAAGAPSPALPNGTYTMTNTASKLVLDDPGLSKKSGVQMIVWSANKGLNQKWKFTSNGAGYYTVQNASSGLLLTDPGAATAPGTKLQQVTAGAGDAQLWAVTASASGAYTLVNKASGLLVDDPGASTKQGTGAVLNSQGGGAEQLWTVK